ncbi:NAD(P)-binding family protein, partial [Vibrio parahaemolyticus V-223/04]
TALHVFALQNTWQKKKPCLNLAPFLSITLSPQKNSLRATSNV